MTFCRRLILVAVGALLLVSGAASAQITGRQLSAMVGLYQVKADFLGEAIACLRPKDTKTLHDAIMAVRHLPESDEREELRIKTNEMWSRLTQNDLCGLLETDAVMLRWDSDEAYPELLGVR